MKVPVTNYITRFVKLLLVRSEVLVQELVFWEVTPFGFVVTQKFSREIHLQSSSSVLFHFCGIILQIFISFRAETFTRAGKYVAMLTVAD
jgi:hypothetical protein